LATLGQFLKTKQTLPTLLNANPLFRSIRLHDSDLDVVCQFASVNFSHVSRLFLDISPKSLRCTHRVIILITANVPCVGEELLIDVVDGSILAVSLVHKDCLHIAHAGPHGFLVRVQRVRPIAPLRVVDQW